MKTRENMTDAERLAAWDRVEDPYEAMEEFFAFRDLVEADPSCARLEDALWAMMDRVLRTSEEGEMK